MDDTKETKEKPETTGDDLIAKLEAMVKVLTEKLQTSKKDEPEGEDLVEKARKTREQESKKSLNEKALEAAIKFSVNSAEWLKNNANLLPKDISDIFKAAEKEKFDSAVEKDSAIKAGIIQSFFSVQSNLDLLTEGPRQALEEYLKLTKTGKQERAQDIYNSIFEPSFEMLRRLKKAEALAKGQHSAEPSEDQYVERMKRLSRKHYIGESKNA